MSDRLVISDQQGPLGVIELAGDTLTSSTPATERLADQFLMRYGDAQAAWAALAELDNGYVMARPG